MLRPQPGRRADQSAFLLILGNLMKILGSFFRGPDRLACACVSNKPFTCLCLRVQSVFEVCCLSGDAKPAPVQGTCWMRRPTTRYRRRRPRPRPAVGLQRRCPFVYRSRGPSLQTAQTASDGVGGRLSLARSVPPVGCCRGSRGTLEAHGSVTRSLEPITAWPPTVPRHPTWPRGFD